jgi:ABC-type branched-subunit amino acid transport system substrate-binding protein
MKIGVVFRLVVCGLLLALVGPATEVQAAKRSQRQTKIGVLASLTGSGSSLGKNTVAALEIAAEQN